MTENGFEAAWSLLKEDKASKKRSWWRVSVKRWRMFFGGMCKACDVSMKECKAMINSMDNVKMSHGDVILMDGL